MIKGETIQGFPSNIPQGKEESKPLHPHCVHRSQVQEVKSKLALGKGDGSQEGENGKFWRHAREHG